MPNIIYYADENNDELSIFKESAKSVGSNLKTFETGNELMDAIDAPSPDPQIVFIDLKEVSDSLRLVKEIRRSESNKLPIVIISECNNNKTVNLFSELGANLYIQKCISNIKLKSAIYYALRINWKTFRTNSKNFFYNYFLTK